MQTHMRDHGHEPVPAHNPYWDRRGVTFEDADGYRVVLQKLKTLQLRNITAPRL